MGPINISQLLLGAFEMGWTKQRADEATRFALYGVMRLGTLISLCQTLSAPTEKYRYIP